MSVTTNDYRTAGGTLDEIVARYRSWKARLAAASKIGIWCDGIPHADTPGGDYVPKLNVQLRDFVCAKMNDVAAGSVLARTFGPLGDYPGSPLPAPGILRSDNLHCAISGAHAVARAVVEAGLAFIPPYDPLARVGLITQLDTGFAGGGTIVAPSSGGSEGGAWSISASPGIGWTKSEDEHLIRWIEFTVSEVTGAAILISGPRHMGMVGAGKSFIPGQTCVDVSALWRIRAGHRNARMPRCYLYDSGGQTMPYDLPSGTLAAAGTTTGPAIDATDEGLSGSVPVPAGNMAGLLNTWAGRVRPTGNCVMPLLAWYFLSNLPVTASIAFAMSQIAIVPD